VALLLLFAAFNRSSGADQTEQPFKSRTDIRQQAEVTVRAAVLTDDESERYFGASRGWRLDEPFDLHSVYQTVRAFLFGSEYLNMHRSARCMFSGASRMSHCRRRATQSASAIICGCGWRRSRLMDFRFGLAKSAATSASS
jgi:hypothetical protein